MLREQTISRKNDKAEGATGLGRKRKEEIGNDNQMTALRFQTSQLPSGGFTKTKTKQKRERERAQ